MNVTAATTEVKARGGDYLTDARILVFLNNAKNALEDTYAWPWLEATTSGPAPLTIADLRAVLYVADTTHDRELLGVDARDLVRWDGDADPTTAGTPCHWWLDGLTSLKVWPVEAVNLSVRYVKYSVELAAGGDTPLIPVRYHPVWVDLAMVEVYKDSDNPQAAQALSADVGVRVGRMVDVFCGRNYQNPEQMPYNPAYHLDG